jgi:hypothetical protein
MIDRTEIMSSPLDTADAAGADAAAADAAAAGLRERLRAAEQRLAEKQSDVEELTGRLERMAEKLDRLHRMGLDRGLRVGGFPKEVIDQQAALVADMQQAVRSWQDVQTGATLGRIEIQLLELRDFVIDRVNEWEAAQHADGPPPADGDAAPPADSADAIAAAPDPEPVGSDLPIEPDVPDVPQAIERVDPPEVVDLARATTAQLQRQSEEQDRFIDYLQSRLEAVNHEHAETGGPMCWYGTPSELDGRLNHVAGQLEEGVALAEYELALQRRLLARKEAAFVERERGLLERLRAMGLPSDAGSE